MSSNNPGGILAAVKNAFIASDGRLRACWQMAISMLAWYALTFISVFFGANAFIRLLAAWGVTSKNLHLTPGWVQYLVSYQASLYHLATLIAAIIAGGLLMRRLKSPRKGAIHTGASMLLGFFISFIIAIGLTLIFMLTDSLRPYTDGGSISIHMLIALILCAATALAEALMAFGYLRSMAAARGNRLAGYAAAVVMFFAMDNFSASGFIGTLNVILMGITLCWVAEKFGIAPVIGLRTGWLWATTSLTSFSGSDVALMRLYPVSETQLTGGSSGLASGFMVTFICGALIWFTLLKPIFAELSRRRKQAKQQNTQK